MAKFNTNRLAAAGKIQRADQYVKPVGSEKPSAPLFPPAPPRWSHVNEKIPVPKNFTPRKSRRALWSQ
jgi:hypothetical protein